MPPSLINQMHQVNILVWNVCGAGSSAFLNNMSEFRRLHNPPIIALLETHINGTRADEVCRKLGFQGCFRVDTQGFVGGIWILWDVATVQLQLIKSHAQYVTMVVKGHGFQSWLFTAIYASPSVHLREHLWRELEGLANSVNTPWLLAGDFNETRSLTERDHGSDDMARRCAKFNNVIENNGLIDLGFSGPIYTWARGTTWSTRKSSRLDRALCNSAWRTRFKEGVVRHLPHSHSDHCPLLISPIGLGVLRSNPKPFRFQAAWMEHRNFEEFLQHKWHSQLPLVTSLTYLAADLCSWNREVFGNLFRRKRKTWARLKGVQ